MECRLLCMLKVIENDLGMLHRNLRGGTWFAEHDNIGTFYEKITDMKDDVTEICISFDMKEPTLEEACDCYPCLEVKDRNPIQSYTEIKKMFEDLIDEFTTAKKKMPPDVQSEWETYQYWLRKTAAYKLERV